MSGKDNKNTEIEILVEKTEETPPALPPMKPRWKKHLGIILASALVLVSVGIYAYRTQSMIKSQKEMLVNKDKSISFLTQDNTSLKKQMQDQSDSYKIQIAEGLKNLQAAKDSSVKITEENAKLREVLKQWQEFYKKIKSKIRVDEPKKTDKTKDLKSK